MVRRLFWLVAGVAIGVWGTTKVNRAARRLTPEGIAETTAVRAAELGGRLRRFTDDVRAGMAEREAELHSLADRRAELTGGAGPDGAEPGGTPGPGGRAGSDDNRVPGPGAAYDQGFPGRRRGNAFDRRDDH